MTFVKDSPDTLIADPVHAEIRNAINIKNALDCIHAIPQLGYCPTKVQEFREKFDLNDDDSQSESVEDSPEERFKTRDLANQVCECRT